MGGRTWLGAALVVAAGFGFAQQAHAQAPFGPTPTLVDPRSTGELREEPPPWQPRTRFGTALLLGGGVGDFLESGADALTGITGSWGARLAVGTRRIVGLELAYVGGLSDVAAQGLTTDASLMRNGGEATLRLNAPIVRGASMLAPFVFAGAGWTRYQLQNGAEVAAIDEQDDVLVLPLGGGLAMSYRGLMLDARFTYRPAYDDELFRGIDMQSWGFATSIGGEF